MVKRRLVPVGLLGRCLRTRRGIGRLRPLFIGFDLWVGVCIDRQRRFGTGVPENTSPYQSFGPPLSRWQSPTDLFEGMEAKACFTEPEVKRRAIRDFYGELGLELASKDKRIDIDRHSLLRKQYFHFLQRSGGFPIFQGRIDLTARNVCFPQGNRYRQVLGSNITPILEDQVVVIPRRYTSGDANKWPRSNGKLPERDEYRKECYEDRRDRHDESYHRNDHAEIIATCRDDKEFS